MIITVLWILLLGRLTSSLENLGCFKSHSDDPDLPTLIFSTATTASECIDACHLQYYKYAGLSVQKCYCGSNYGRHGISNTCATLCTNDSSSLCGSYEAINVYATGQKGPSPPRMLRLVPKKPRDLEVSWSFPDLPNGNIISYTIRAEAVNTYSSQILLPFESQVEGGLTNMTILKDLQPGTKYNVSIVATNADGDSAPASVTGWTFIGPPEKPPVPKILEKNSTTIKIFISEGRSENGPVSSYRVVVAAAGVVPPTSSDIAYPDFMKSKESGLLYYVTGAFDASDYEKYKIFVVGNERIIGGYYNPSLNMSPMAPQIGVAVVSRIGKEVQYSYSNLTNILTTINAPSSAITILLWIGIILLGGLLIASFFIYFMIRKKYEKGQTRLSEHQELTLQGPMCEVDNMAYIPEDVPESTNHYQELKRKVWSIPRNFLTVDNKVLRRGRFGSVHPGTVQKDGKILPATVHNISDVSMKQSEKRQMLRELGICIKAGSMEYLAGLIGTCETPDTLYVAMEMPSETLKNRLILSRTGTAFPGERIMSIGSAVASALQHLDSIKIVHNFVCARSVGIDGNFKPKLMGHGIAKYALEDIRYARWTAIECFSNYRKNQTGMVWAFGVLLWEMFSLGGTPYANLIMDSDVEEAVEQGTRLQQLKDIPDPIYEVMLSCWQVDPQERPTFDELVRLDTLSCCPVITSTEPYLPELELNQ